MTASELRKKYLDFFKARNHVIIPSASLLPENDPTTLFTGSGMQPMIPFLLGESHPEGKRIADSQKCFRTQDIEEIGDNRHTTVFEMLGNWSLGDYFKNEHIEWMFTFLTKELKLDPKRLYFTVFRGNPALNIPRDDEAVSKWQELFKTIGVDAKTADFSERDGMKDGRIFFYDEKKNWWSRAGTPDKMPVGEPGGPDSEMFWDFGAELKIHETSPWKNEVCHVNCDCGRFVEIGNNVFMQYRKTANGFETLAQKNIDFGGGLERLASAVDDNPDIFRSDVFKTLRETIESLSGKQYGANANETFAFRIAMDHMRAAVFLIGDGATPSNKDQGYFTRRLIRRALRFADKLGIKEAMATKVANAVIASYGDHYTALQSKKDFILTELEKEEDKFKKTLAQGLREFEKISSGAISGVDAFNLYQSYGFPIEVTEELAKERGLSLDRIAFDLELKKHQELSRTASAGMFKGGLADASVETTRLHTAAHLMLAALRTVLGNHIEQAGSNITAERLRFDFRHGAKMTDEEKKKVEDLVNEAIIKDLPVTIEELSKDEAKAKGATGIFDEKYGAIVKVYKIGSGSNQFSYEICGGPHVTHTGELGGTFKITKEEASSQGVRRIKAIIEKKKISAPR
jgi:alanyl-tRNA synthetase